MAEFIEKLKATFEGPIDFPSQKWTHTTATNFLTLGALLAFIVGFLSESLSNLVYTFAAVLIFVLLLIVPPWPAYNKVEKIKWLEPKVPTFETVVE